MAEHTLKLKATLDTSEIKAELENLNQQKNKALNQSGSTGKSFEGSQLANVLNRLNNTLMALNKAFGRDFQVKSKEFRTPVQQAIAPTQQAAGKQIVLPNGFNQLYKSEKYSDWLKKEQSNVQKTILANAEEMKKVYSQFFELAKAYGGWATDDKTHKKQIDLLHKSAKIGRKNEYLIQYRGYLKDQLSKEKISPQTKGHGAQQIKSGLGYGIAHVVTPVGQLMQASTNYKTRASGRALESSGNILQQASIGGFMGSQIGGLWGGVIGGTLGGLGGAIQELTKIIISSKEAIGNFKTSLENVSKTIQQSKQVVATRTFERWLPNADKGSLKRSENSKLLFENRLEDDIKASTAKLEKYKTLLQQNKEKYEKASATTSIDAAVQRNSALEQSKILEERIKRTTAELAENTQKLNTIAAERKAIQSRIKEIEQQEIKAKEDQKRLEDQNKHILENRAKNIENYEIDQEQQNRLYGIAKFQREDNVTGLTNQHNAIALILSKLRIDRDNALEDYKNAKPEDEEKYARNFDLAKNKYDFELGLFNNIGEILAQKIEALQAEFSIKANDIGALANIGGFGSQSAQGDPLLDSSRQTNDILRQIANDIRNQNPQPATYL